MNPKDKEALAGEGSKVSARAVEQRRVATHGDQLIRGVGVISDLNGPFTLRFRIDGVLVPVTLDTRKWKVRWEDEWRASHSSVPTNTDREALWDFAGDLLQAWNIEDTNEPSLTEQFRDMFVARFGVTAPTPKPVWVSSAGTQHSYPVAGEGQWVFAPAPSETADRKALTAIRDAYERGVDMRPAGGLDFILTAIGEALNRVVDSDGEFRS